MPSKERSLVRGIAVDAWNDIRKRPLMWLILAASSIPLVFLVNFFLPSLFGMSAFSQTTYMVLQLAGYAICFALFFLFWCMAVYYFDDETRGKGRKSYAGAYERMKGWSLPSLWAGLVAGLIRVFALMAAQIVLSMVMSFLVSGETTESSLRVLYYVYFYLNFIVADLVIVFIVLVPQMLALEGGRRVEEVFRASYRLVKERYRDALILLIIPEFITATFYLGAAILEGNLSLGRSITPVLLLFVVLLEGGRTAFLAAAFNRFYYHILEEEKKKKKAKPKKQGAAQPAAKKRPPGKQQPRKKSTGKKTRKR
ncbi:MAG: hypothetical protein C4536_10625 [Actinobacteria bacterium]|nr:MAG: hypothetical protein C4536_10625 [Actinomycetota bacterium]